MEVAAQLLLIFIPNTAWIRPKLPSPCPAAAWRGFTRQNVLEKAQSGAPGCVGMDKKKVNQGMASRFWRGY